MSASATAASTACLQPLSVLHSGLQVAAHLRRNNTANASPIGYEATMSLAMELETKLKGSDGAERYSDPGCGSEEEDVDDSHEKERSRLSQNGTESPPSESHPNGVAEERPIRTDTILTSPDHRDVSNGREDYEVDRPSREASPARSVLVNGNPSAHLVTSTPLTDDHQHDDMVDDDMDDDDVSIAGHSLGSDGHCGSYGEMSNGLLSVDNNSKDEDMMEDDLDRHMVHGGRMHGEIIDRSRSPGRGGGGHHHHLLQHQRTINGGSRPESSDGDYYDGAGSESSQHHLQQRVLPPLQIHPRHMGGRGEEGGLVGEGGDTGGDGQLYQCHLCTFTTSSKYQLNMHVNSHYDYKCEHCDYTSRTEGRLKRHMKDFHAELPADDFSPGSDGGKLSSSGGGPGSTPNQPNKVKTYRCKQCAYVATVKTDFWDHSKTHIKAERLLTCPRCPFVTEYKHHLEYHLRNHFGSKPFKCPKCNYSCVNKSMLNSHMKSHSNIYQYRCADCTYATKYCHSLKLHLRKYGHKPATVLNPDGSPNPMPVIDVYGTRRGPRPKKSQHHHNHQDELYSNGNGGGSGSLTFSPMQMPSVNGALSPTTVLPFFYGPPPVGLMPNGFHSNGGEDGLLQQQNSQNAKSQQPPPHNNGGGGNNGEMMSGGGLKNDNGPENGRYRCSSAQTGALKCNLCEFATDHRELFSKHMLSHAATDNQDLCNLYGINSETLLQDPNHQPPMNVAAMAAVAAALGLSGHSSQQRPPDQRHPHHHRQQQHTPQGSSAPHHGVTPSDQGQSFERKEGESPNQMHQSGFKSNGRQSLHQSQPAPHSEENIHQMAQSMMPNPLEHLRGFSEQFTIQPFMVREYSSHLFSSPSGNNGGLHAGHQPGQAGPRGGMNGGVHPEVAGADGAPHLNHSPPGGKQPTPSASPSSHRQTGHGKTSSKDGAIRGGGGGGRALQSTPVRGDGSGVPGLRPLDLSSAKGVGRSMPFPHHQLSQHLQLQQFAHQQFYAQQQQQQLHHHSARFPSVSPGAHFGANHGLLEIATTPAEDGGGAGPSPSSITSPTQSKNRRKGRAFKLDRICMKLQKERASPPLGGAEDLADDSTMEDGGSEHATPTCHKASDETTLSPESGAPGSKPLVYGDNTYQGLVIKTELDCDVNTDDVVVSDQSAGHPATDDDDSPKVVIKCAPILPTVVELSPPAIIKTMPTEKEKVVSSPAAVDSQESKEEASDWKEAYQCQYCDMAFKDCIMYAVHMGYHGFKDPFKCNMCGHQTKDKVAFFLHIARTAHL